MKQYLIRSIGWVFDDDWYNNDGEHDIIEGTYNSLEEAKKKCNHLNYVYFLNYFDYLNKFQLDFSYNSYERPNFVNLDLIASLMAKELELKKDRIFNKKSKTLNIDKKDLKRITAEQVDAILSKAGFRFFKILEVDSSELFFYYFKRNPEIWEFLYNQSYYLDPPDDFYYFFDDRDLNNNKRLANSIRDCYYYALKDNRTDFLLGLINLTVIKGEFNDLSELPNLLKNIIDNSPNIDYQRGEVIFTKEITVEELVKLDSVLKKPLLITEKVSIEQIKKIRIDNFLQRWINKEFGLE